MADTKPLRILVAGGAGFIGSHLAKRLKEEGHYVVVADWAVNPYFAEKEYCSEFRLLDLRKEQNCEEAVNPGGVPVDHVYNLAADMGGMGFIESNHSVILQNNLRINLNLLQSATRHKCSRFFFASSACVYPDYAQTKAGEDTPNLKESDAWPADIRSNAYGFEKLVAEEACKWHAHDNAFMQVRIARFHNIYGPQGTWKGGREKAPAAFCRKVLVNDAIFPMWGDGEQTRSFCYIEDCVEGVLRIMRGPTSEPLNLGSDVAISMNDLAKLIMTFEKKNLKIHHIKGPQGVRGRNSDNTLIAQTLGWAPSISMEEGLRKTYFWIKQCLEDEQKAGKDLSVYRESQIVHATVEDEGDKVRDGGL